MIKIKKFDKMIERAKKRITNQEIQSIKNTINMIFRSISSAIYNEREKLEEDSKEETSKIAYKSELAIQKILKDCLTKVSYNVPTEDEAHILNAYQGLLYNHSKRKDIYNRIKEMEMSQLEKGRLGDNTEKNEEFLMKQILYLYRKVVDTISEKEYIVLKEYKKRAYVKRMAENKFSKEDMEKLEARAKMIGKEEEKIDEAFQDARDIFSDNIRMKYIDGLLVIGKIIKKFGLFRSYEQRENTRLEELGIEGEKINLEEYFNKEFLETVSIKTLIAMNVFWENRLTKEIERINNANFILQDLNLMENILQDKEEYKSFPFEKVTDDEIEKELIKTEILKEISQICVDKMEEDLKNQKRVEKKVQEIEISSYVNEVSSEYQEEYNEYFSKLNPSTMNILAYDIEDRYMTGKNIVNNLYKGKNANVLALIESCITRDTIQNWGYVEEDNNLGNFIILGFDIEGLNMPLRIHIPKDFLKEFLESNEIENIIPIYKGNEDFRRLGELIKTPALIPISPNVQKQIEEMQINRRGSIQQSMYLEHLKYLAKTTTENFPQSLKTPKVIGKGKKQKVKYLIKKEYIDLDTKQKYEKDKEGNYVPIPEKEAR